MKVHNLTDVSTSALVGAELVNTALLVGGVSVQPGESADVTSIAGADRFLRLEAIFVGDKPPASYLDKKPKRDLKPAIALKHLGDKQDPKPDVKPDPKPDPRPENRPKQK